MLLLLVVLHSFPYCSWHICFLHLNQRSLITVIIISFPLAGDTSYEHFIPSLLQGKEEL